jgi:hypothetical protein
MTKFGWSSCARGSTLRGGKVLVLRFAFYLAILPLSWTLACGQKADASDDDGGAGSGATGGAGAVTGSNSTQGTGGAGGSSGAATNTSSGTGGAAGAEPTGGTGGSDADADGDSISDRDEGAPDLDTDGDGTPDYLDLDSDDDGISDGFEAGDDNLATPPRDTDGDGIPDFQDSDSDGDGIPDATEIAGGFDTDGDLVPDYLDLDSDNDDVPDAEEIAHGLDPRDPDSDGDTISDGDDGLEDADDDGVINALDDDSDGDGYLDADEAGDALVDTPPIDTDFDGIPNFLDLDSDGDGLPDDEEEECGLLLEDGDGDGFIDLVEALTGADPCNAGDTVLDHGVEFFFVLPYEGPEQNATLRFVPRVQKADVFFNIDTTGSMGGVITSLKAGLGSIMSSTRTRLSDSAFGVAGFEDFPLSPYGGSGDEPFHLYTGITTNEATAQAGANALTLGSGGDGPESGYEALFQAAVGTGISGAGGNFGPFTVPDRIGGAQFRLGALPIFVHATDAESHDTEGTLAYPSSYNAHGRTAALDALQGIGARVITIQNGTSSTAAASLREISEHTRAVVPPCSFKTSETEWRCGADQCCLPNATAPTLGAGGLPECVLRYQLQNDGTGLSDVTTDGIDAIIKYAKFDVLAQGRDDGDETTPDTGDFLTRVVANTPDDSFKPPLEPELSCNPVPVPAAFDGASYDNGFSGFAVGSSSATREGARLFFTVHAQNDTVRETAEPQVFEAFIDIVDVQTGAVLDTQDVLVIVPARPGGVGE